MIKTWITDEDHRVTEEDRHPLELYAQLTDDEFLNVHQELQSESIRRIALLFRSMVAEQRHKGN